MAILASLVVEFDSDAGGAFLEAAFDSEMNEDSAGNTKSSFVPGDSIYYRVWASMPYVVTVTDGVDNLIEAGKIENDSGGISWVNAKDSSVSRPVYSGIPASVYWYGTNGGGITVVPPKTLRLASLAVAIGFATYQTRFDLRRLTAPSYTPAPGQTDYAIIIYIKGEGP